MADDMLPDLSHLSAEERAIIEEVLQRQKQEADQENQMSQQYQRELEDIEKQIKERVEKAQRVIGTQEDAICQICQKVKFSDGIGRKCQYCGLRFCVRCGGKQQVKVKTEKAGGQTKQVQACSLCQRKQEILAKTGKWFKGGECGKLDESPTPTATTPSASQQQLSSLPGGGTGGPHPADQTHLNGGRRRQGSLSRQNSLDQNHTSNQIGVSSGGPGVKSSGNGHQGFNNNNNNNNQNRPHDQRNNNNNNNNQNMQHPNRPPYEQQSARPSQGGPAPSKQPSGMHGPARSGQNLPLNTNPQQKSRPGPSAMPGDHRNSMSGSATGQPVRGQQSPPHAMGHGGHDRQGAGGRDSPSTKHDRQSRRSTAQQPHISGNQQPHISGNQQDRPSNAGMAPHGSGTVDSDFYQQDGVNGPNFVSGDRQRPYPGKMDSGRGFVNNSSAGSSGAKGIGRGYNSNRIDEKPRPLQNQYRDPQAPYPPEHRPPSHANPRDPRNRGDGRYPADISMGTSAPRSDMDRKFSSRPNNTDGNVDYPSSGSQINTKYDDRGRNVPVKTSQYDRRLDDDGRDNRRVLEQPTNYPGDSSYSSDRVPRTGQGNFGAQDGRDGFPPTKNIGEYTTETFPSNENYGNEPKYRGMVGKNNEHPNHQNYSHRDSNYQDDKYGPNTGYDDTTYNSVRDQENADWSRGNSHVRRRGDSSHDLSHAGRASSPSLVNRGPRPGPPSNDPTAYGKPTTGDNLGRRGHDYGGPPNGQSSHHSNQHLSGSNQPPFDDDRTPSNGRHPQQRPSSAHEYNRGDPRDHSHRGPGSGMDRDLDWQISRRDFESEGGDRRRWNETGAGKSAYRDNISSYGERGFTDQMVPFGGSNTAPPPAPGVRHHGLGPIKSAVNVERSRYDSRTGGTSGGVGSKFPNSPVRSAYKQDPGSYSSDGQSSTQQQPHRQLPAGGGHLMQGGIAGGLGGSSGPQAPKHHHHTRHTRHAHHRRQAATRLSASHLQRSFSSSDDEIRSTPEPTSNDDFELESESVSEKGDLRSDMPSLRKTRWSRDQKLANQHKLPVVWQPSSSRTHLIGTMTLQKRSLGRGFEPSLGLKVQGGCRKRNGMLGAIVKKVQKGSVTDIVGHIREGDEVLEWNGNSLKNLSYEQVCQIVNDSKYQAAVTLTVARKLTTSLDDLLDLDTTLHGSNTPHTVVPDLGSELLPQTNPGMPSGYSHQQVAPMAISLVPQPSASSGSTTIAFHHQSHDPMMNAVGFGSTGTFGLLGPSPTGQHQPISSVTGLPVSAVTGTLPNAAGMLGGNPMVMVTAPPLGAGNLALAQGMSGSLQKLPLGSTGPAAVIVHGAVQPTTQGLIFGQIQIAVYHDPVQYQLMLTIYQARDLAARPDASPRNPYVKTFLLPDRSERSQRKSKILMKTCSPVWDQTFLYPGLRKRDLSGRLLEITLWDYDRYAHNDFLGEVLLDLSITPLDNQARWYALTDIDDDVSQRARLRQQRCSAYASQEYLPYAARGVPGGMGGGGVNPGLLSDVFYSGNLGRFDEFEPSSSAYAPFGRDFDLEYSGYRSDSGVADRAVVSGRMPRSRTYHRAGAAYSPSMQYANDESGYYSDHGGKVHRHHYHSRSGSHAAGLFDDLDYSSSGDQMPPGLANRSSSRYFDPDTGEWMAVAPGPPRRAGSGRRHHSASRYGSSGKLAGVGSSSGGRHHRAPFYHRSEADMIDAVEKQRQLPQIPDDLYGEEAMRELNAAADRMRYRHRTGGGANGGGRHHHRPSRRYPSGLTNGMGPGIRNGGEVGPTGRRMPHLAGGRLGHGGEVLGYPIGADYQSDGSDITSTSIKSTQSERPRTKTAQEFRNSLETAPEEAEIAYEEGAISDSALSEPMMIMGGAGGRGGPGGRKPGKMDMTEEKRRRSLMTRLMGKSSSERNVNDGKKRLGFPRSEEVGIPPCGRMVAGGYDDEYATDGQGGYDSGPGDSGVWSAPVAPLPCDTALGEFVQDLGPGQVVGRQVLASPCLGEIQLGLAVRQGMLEVEVVRGRAFKVKADAKFDPATYVKVELIEGKEVIAKAKTPLSRRTRDPYYEQQLVFTEPYHGRMLQVSVLGDFGRMDRRVFMGIALINLDQLDLSALVMSWYKLYGNNSLLGTAAGARKDSGSEYPVSR